MGAYDEALASQREAALAAPAQEAECLAALAVTFSGACRWRELDETLAAFEAHDPDSPQLAATMAALRVSRAYGVGNLREALAAADQALPSVRCHLPRQTTVSFVNSIAVLNCLAGRYEKARELLAQAQAECDTYLLLKPIVELQRLTHAMLLAQEGWLEESLAVFAEAELSPGAQADGVLLAELYVHRAAALRRARRLEEAGASYAQALRLDGLAPLDRLNVQNRLGSCQALGRRRGGCRSGA